MDVWALLVAYLGAFVLVQIALYRYLRDRSDDEPRMAVAGPPNADRGRGEADDPRKRREVGPAVGAVHRPGVRGLA